MANRVSHWPRKTWLWGLPNTTRSITSDKVDHCAVTIGNHKLKAAISKLETNVSWKSPPWHNQNLQFPRKPAMSVPRLPQCLCPSCVCLEIWAQNMSRLQNLRVAGQHAFCGSSGDRDNGPPVGTVCGKGVQGPWIWSTAWGLAPAGLEDTASSFSKF